MKKIAQPTTDPQVLAIIHRAGRSWRGLIASTKAPTPAVVASKEFSTDTLNRFDDWLNEHQAASVLCVLPSSAVICRTVPLPDASQAQLEQALNLQAEAHLLGIAPPHRLAMAILPNAPGETSRTGLVLAWPEAAAFSAPPTSRPVTFVPDVAALAAILNGQRPDEILMWLDRVDGSVALAITHSAGAVFRAVREDSQSPDDWQRNIARIAAETGLSVGHTGAFIDQLAQDAQRKAGSLGVNDARLFLPQHLIAAAASRAQGFTADQNWWSQFGISAGALLARTGPLAALTRLQDSAPVVTPSRVRSAMEKLSKPRFAVTVITACVLILMFGPLAVSALRLVILKVRFGELKDEVRAAVESKNQLAVYTELEKQKIWPMTKLLADITANTPLGIELETIRIEAGKDFAVGGTALANDGHTPAQLVAAMQENFSRGGVFNDVAVNSGKTDNLGRYKFDLSAKVIKPYVLIKLGEDRDFAKNPLKDRLYGKPAAEKASPPDENTGTIAVAAADPPTDFDSPPDRPGTENPDFTPPDSLPSRGNSSGAGINPGMPGEGPGTVSPSLPPPPLNEEQIKVMSRAELKDALGKVAKARLNKALDKDVQTRLKQEQDLIMEYLRKAGS